MTRDFVSRTTARPPPCRDNRIISGFLPDSRRYPCGSGAGYRHKATRYLRIPTRDRSNGGVALPALVGVRTYVPNTSVFGGEGKPRRRRATPGCLRELRSLSVHGAEDVTRQPRSNARFAWAIDRCPEVSTETLLAPGPAVSRRPRPSAAAYSSRASQSRAAGVR